MSCLARLLQGFDTIKSGSEMPPLSGKNRSDSLAKSVVTAEKQNTRAVKVRLWKPDKQILGDTRNFDVSKMGNVIPVSRRKKCKNRSHLE